MTTYYSEEHEWVTVDGDSATVGITNHAAESLGDIVFLELKDSGEQCSKGDEIGVIESVKAASEIYAPISGEIIEANTGLVDEPSKVNENPEGDAWLYKIKLSDSSELADLMDKAKYDSFIA